MYIYIYEYIHKYIYSVLRFRASGLALDIYIYMYI